MTYTFKLSRRLARLRGAAAVAASLLALSCSDAPSGPGSTLPGADPTSVVITPDSISVGANQTVQFEAITDTSGPLALNLGNGKGRGRRKVVSVALSPVSSSMVPGGSQSFSATATLNDGSTVRPALAWTATGGTVDPSGRYTAGKTSGKYRVIATASNGVADTAAVSITAIAPILAQIVLSPASISLPAGGSQQFAAEGRSADSATVSVTPTYTATGGTISPAGVYTAGQTPGSFRVIATDPATGVADTSAVTITALGVTLQSVVLMPATASVAQGAKQQFSASGRMSDGSTVPISPSFTATGGSVSSSGEYTAGSTAGTYRVIATDQASGNADTSSVTITASLATLQAVILTPATVSLAAGANQQFAAAGKMSDGSTTSVSVTWSASGGTISSAGLYTAGQTAGTFRVIASESGGTLSDTSAVTVTAPPPPSSSQGCPASGYTRLVNVSTVSQLTAAINAAQPGDQIRMAPATYSLNGFININNDGTSANPITLCGPRTAVIDFGSIVAGNGWRLYQYADWWVVKGITLRNGVSGVRIRNAHNNVYDSVLVEHTGQEAIDIDGTSSNNTIQHCTIRDTGNYVAGYGEGVYIGNGSTNADPSNNNKVLYNTFGPDVRADHVDIKKSATGNLVQGNVSDATGWVESHSGQYTTGIYVTGGANTQFLDNISNNLDDVDGNAFQSLYTTGTVFHRNTVRAIRLLAGFSVSGGGATMYCDNVVTWTVSGRISDPNGCTP